MITAVDSCVLIDILTDDQEFADASADRLRRALARGAVVACAPVWAEVGSGFTEPNSVREVFSTLRIDYSEVSEEVALAAGEGMRRYRDRGGRRVRIASDFLIAAHAAVNGFPLLTRDQGLAKLPVDGLSLAD